MTEPKMTLITGGSRSGKSRMALQKGADYERKVFLATAVATDEEMKKRIERHQKERGSEYVTLEEPLRLAAAIRRKAGEADLILVDCLTFWLNNLFHTFGTEDPAPESGPVSSEIRQFLALLEESPTSLILVTNEINMGVVAPDPATRRFVECQGWLNQEVARRSDEVILMVAGLPQFLKEEILRVRPG